MPEDAAITRTAESDLDAVAALLSREGEGRSVSGAYLRWWYFGNPSRSFSFFHLGTGGAVSGVATTNNFRLTIDGRPTLVALPQKVMTSGALRGKGHFGRLYRETESDNLRQGVGCFVTFTNAMSTPIFLEKFGYRRGRSPDLFLVPAMPGLFRKKSHTLQNGLDADYLARTDLLGHENSVQKDSEYYHWRYAGHEAGQYVILGLGAAGGTAGIALLKRKTVRRVPLYFVMDLVAHDPGALVELLAQARIHAARAGALGIVALENSSFPDRLPFAGCRRIRGRFNFLVKGRSPEETQALAALRFNWFGGDLDFI